MQTFPFCKSDLWAHDTSYCKVPPCALDDSCFCITVRHMFLCKDWFQIAASKMIFTEYKEVYLFPAINGLIVSSLFCTAAVLHNAAQEDNSGNLSIMSPYPDLHKYSSLFNKGNSSENGLHFLDPHHSSSLCRPTMLKLIQ